MQTLYIFLSIVSILYIILKKRRFDFFSIAVLATAFYYYPAYLGQIKVEQDVFDKIITETYVCLIIQITLLLLFVVFYDALKAKSYINVQITDGVDVDSKVNTNKYNNLAMFILGCLGVVLLLYTVVTYSSISGSFDKTELLENSNRLTEYLKYISMFVFVYAFCNSGRYIWSIRALGTLLIGYTFFLGHRSFIVIALIIIFLNYLSKTNGDNSLLTFARKHKFIFFMMLFSAFFFFFVKNVFAALIDGDYDLVISRLTSKEYYINMILSSEANAITSNLNEVCKTGFKYSVIDYFGSLLSLVPLIGGMVINSFGIIFFEDKLNEQFNDKLEEGYGIGSTFLGELYATGNFIFVLIGIVAVYIAFYKISKCKILKKKGISKVYIDIIMIYFAFYMHRNSLIFLLLMARAYLYILLLIVFLRFMIKSFLKWGRNNGYR